MDAVISKFSQQLNIPFATLKKYVNNINIKSTYDGSLYNINASLSSDYIKFITSDLYFSIIAPRIFRSLVNAKVNTTQLSKRRSKVSTV